MTFYERASLSPYAPDFSFMDEYRGRLGVTAYDLLHGYCNIFAKAVNSRFGYRTFSITDEYGTLVHCYARAVISDEIVKGLLMRAKERRKE